MDAAARVGSNERRTDGDRPGMNPQRRLLRGYLHKTSNSLCGIKGYAGLILAGGDQARIAAKWAAKIIKEIERMEEIFRSVGDLTRAPRAAEGGADLADVVSGTVHSATSGHSNLHCRCEPLPLCELLLPAADLSLVLAALLDNSAESGADDRGVNVTLSGAVEPTGRISLTLRDDGPGIPTQVLTQATEPFLSTKEGHLGIGLSRVETLLDMYDLTWALWSETGTGTVVTLEVGAPLTTTVEIV